MMIRSALQARRPRVDDHTGFPQQPAAHEDNYSFQSYSHRFSVQVQPHEDMKSSVGCARGSFSRGMSESPRPRRRGRGKKSDTISSAYKHLGASHIHGVRSVYPMKNREQILERIDPEYTAVRLHSAPEEQIDALMYILTNVPPTMRLSATRAKTHSALFDMLDREAKRLQKDQPGRTKMLAADLSNYKEVATRLGYPQELWADRSASAAAQQSPPAPSGGAKLPRMLALTDVERLSPRSPSALMAPGVRVGSLPQPALAPASSDSDRVQMQAMAKQLADTQAQLAAAQSAAEALQQQQQRNQQQQQEMQMQVEQQQQQQVQQQQLQHLLLLAAQSQASQQLQQQLPTTGQTGGCLFYERTANIFYRERLGVSMCTRTLLVFPQIFPNP